MKLTLKFQIKTFVTHYTINTHRLSAKVLKLLILFSGGKCIGEEKNSEFQ